MNLQRVARITRLLRSGSLRAAILPLIMALAWMPSATPAWAAAQRIVLSGGEYRVFGPPGSVTTAGPWTFIKDQPLTGTFVFGALSGTETQLVNAKLDFATGSGFVWGKVSYTDTASGVVCTGNLEGKLTAFLITGDIVAQCSNGALLRGTLQDVTATPGVDVSSTFNGELLDPH